MFVIYDSKEQHVPAKIWLPNSDDLEENCMEQVIRSTQLPFLHKHVAIMPDAHMGSGINIGSVIATKGVIIPNAVGSDGGCGMAFVKTNIPVELLYTTTDSGELRNAIGGMITRNVPVGEGKRHSEPKDSKALDMIYTKLIREGANAALLPHLEAAYYQLCTLGGGNHFIELQADENNEVCIMIHTGSRNLGYQVCNYFNKVAKEFNECWYSSVPSEWKLPFLPVGVQAGKDYIEWMQIALTMARENRHLIMEQVKSCLYNSVKKYTDFARIREDENFNVNAHHNYAALEHHFGANVWVHRKGAIRVREGELGIIPGAMGNPSYIVRGLGNPESFHSCSHGAGRIMSRTKAKAELSVERTMNLLKERNVVLCKAKKDNVSEESPEAYKNIEEVMANQTDLVDIVKKLRTVAVMKG